VAATAPPVRAPREEAVILASSSLLGAAPAAKIKRNFHKNPCHFLPSFFDCLIDSKTERYARDYRHSGCTIGFATLRGAARPPLRDQRVFILPKGSQASLMFRKKEMLPQLFRFCENLLDSGQNPASISATSEPVEGLRRVHFTAGADFKSLMRPDAVVHGCCSCKPDILLRRA
jgi:hypothetical protein